MGARTRLEAHYIRLVADQAGELHFADVRTALAPADFAPPAPLLHLSAGFAAERFVFLAAPEGWFGDWHPAPRRQVFVFLSGEIEVEASDGQRRRFLPGDCLLMEDTTGKGHATRNVGTGEVLMAVTQLPDDATLSAAPGPRSPERAADQ
jgi:quercetin dioxygenase-like cupin family protein